MKAHSQSTPDAVRTSDSATPPLLFVVLSTSIAGRDLKIVFPDSDHAALYSYGRNLDAAAAPSEQAVRDGALRLFRRFRRWWEPAVPCRSSRCRHDGQGALVRLVDVNSLALDYVEDIHESADNPRNIVDGVIRAPVFVEPDHAEAWWEEKARLLHEWHAAARRFSGRGPRTSPGDRPCAAHDRPTCLGPKRDEKAGEG